MSRVNKYRGMHIRVHPQNEHLNGTWIYGYLSDENYINSIDLEREFLVDKDTIGQYIGVDDKNGKEIYEGDIVKTNSGRLCKVVWFSSPQYQGWDLIPIETKNPVPKERELWSDLEVIGNVYENADLLKEVE